MLQMTIKITGTEEVIAKLRKLGTGLLQFETPLRQIGAELKSYYSGQVFASQGGVLGVRWPTLAAKTMLYKRRRYPEYATTPLIRTGTMKESFDYRATARTLRVFNTAPYFVYHQSTAPRRIIPYRPMIGVNDDVGNIIKKIMQADIKRKIEAL